VPGLVIFVEWSQNGRGRTEKRVVVVVGVGACGRA
jgi:hypothetical protein